MKGYDISELPLQIHPGDNVFFVIVDTDEIQEDMAASVGINCLSGRWLRPQQCQADDRRV